MGRHRQGAVEKKPPRGAVVGCAGVVTLLCGALVYAVGATGSEPVEPDPPRRSAPAKSTPTRPTQTPTLAAPVAPTPGADMKRQPIPRQTQARPAVSQPTTSKAAKQRKPAASPTRPRVRRTGRCYQITYNGGTYLYCPGRTGKPRR